MGHFWPDFGWVVACPAFYFLFPRRRPVFALLAAFGASSLSVAQEPPCSDSNSACGSWADAGECGKNVGFMKAECAESCGFCTPPHMLTAADDPLLGPERVVLSIHYGENKYGEVQQHARLNH